MRSVRGSRPKMASDSVTEPAFLPSRVVTCSSMSLAPCGLTGRILTSRVLSDRNRGDGRIISKLEFAGCRHAVRQFLFHGVAHRDPAASHAGNGAFDHDQAAFDVGLPDFEIECGHPIDAKMARHFFV